MSDAGESSAAGPSADVAALQVQLVGMQEVLMHVQREVEQMHEVLLSQQAVIDRLLNDQVRLAGRLEQLESTDEPRSPEDERPPHY